MIYRVEFTSPARFFVTHLPPAVKQEIKEGIRLLSRSPYSGEPLKRELIGTWKLKVGRYRVIYQVEPHRRVVLVLAVGHRRDIYERVSGYSSE